MLAPPPLPSLRLTLHSTRVANVRDPHESVCTSATGIDVPTNAGSFFLNLLQRTPRPPAVLMLTCTNAAAAEANSQSDPGCSRDVCIQKPKGNKRAR